MTLTKRRSSGRGRLVGSGGMGMSVRVRAVVSVASVCGLLAIGFAERANTAPGESSTSLVTTLAVPGRANAHVSLSSKGLVVAAVWSAALPDGVTDIFAAVSRDGGRTFAAPVRVNQQRGEARVNGEQPPRVAIAVGPSDRPRVSVIWTAKGAKGTLLLTARSDDLGRTFSESTLVTGTDAAGNRGWEAIGADASGRFHAVWLDHRRMAAATAASAPGAHKHKSGDGSGSSGDAAAIPKPDGVAMAQQSDLYFDTIGDAVSPRPITPGVCYCCKIAIAFGARDQIFLAWRHVYPGNFRDVAFSVSDDGGRAFSPPARVSEDNWWLEGCPDDGPAMAVDARRGVHIVWPAVVTEQGTPTKALFHAMTADGRVFTPRQRLPTEGQANHPQLAVGADGTLRLAWDEAGGGRRAIVQGRGLFDQAGRVSFSRAPLGGESGVYPMVAATPSGALVAWTAGAPSESVIKVAQIQ